MIVRGNPDDLQINRGGHVSPNQSALIGRLTPFRLPALPSILVGVLLVVYGLTRRDSAGWFVLALGVVLLASGWSRHRQRTTLQVGAVHSFIGVLERIRPSPLGMFEAELTLDGRSYVVLANLGDRPLNIGTRYRSFVVRGVARMGIIVGMEEA